MRTKRPANESYKDPICLFVKLNASEWCELINAVHSKAVRVARGEYGDRDPFDKFNPQEWVKELMGIEQKLEKLLGDNDIPF